MKAPVLTALLLVAIAAHAQTPVPTVTSRLSSVVGNFTVGYSRLGDGGSFNETLRTLDAVFSRNQADSGGDNGFVAATPVQGNASLPPEVRRNQVRCA
jgi:hypothetical protein